MNNSKKTYIIMAVIAVVIATAVFVIKAKSDTNHVITPNEAREFLNDLDMPTRDYEETAEQGEYGEYEARSDYYKLETRDDNRYINNLTYYVEGDSKSAKAVLLVLNVNDITFGKKAVDEMMKYSDSLMNKVTGKNLTPEMKKAIQTKTEAEWTIDGYKITLNVENSPNDDGDEEDSTSDPAAFSLTFLIELSH